MLRETPAMTVRKNLRFPLQMQKMKRSDMDERVDKVARIKAVTTSRRVGQTRSRIRPVTGLLKDPATKHITGSLFSTNTGTAMWATS